MEVTILRKKRAGKRNIKCIGYCGAGGRFFLSKHGEYYRSRIIEAFTFRSRKRNYSPDLHTWKNRKRGLCKFKYESTGGPQMEKQDAEQASKNEQLCILLERMKTNDPQALLEFLNLFEEDMNKHCRFIRMPREDALQNMKLGLIELLQKENLYHNETYQNRNYIF